MTGYWKPANFLKEGGSERRVGFELEFGNLGIEKTARALQELLGGELEEENPYFFRLNDSAIGEIRIERDAEILSDHKYRAALDKLGISCPEEDVVLQLEKNLDKLSSVIIPGEIVTAPLRHRDFTRLDEIHHLLGRLGAEGTDSAPTNAFGLHLNPEVPDLEPATILGYLQSFLLLNDWIIATSGVNLTRRFLTSYIDPFPEEYQERVLDPEYRPGQAELIDDYLRFSPTRNRALDLLPILCELDEERVRAALSENDDSLLGARPAFHYRLPDFRLEDDRWTIASEWNRWWYVEAVARETAVRKDLIAIWQARNDRWLNLFRKNWARQSGELLNARIKPPAEPG